MKKQAKKNLNLDDLALMVSKGFNEVKSDINEVKKDIKDLKDG